MAGRSIYQVTNSIVRALTDQAPEVHPRETARDEYMWMDKVSVGDLEENYGYLDGVELEHAQYY